MNYRNVNIIGMGFYHPTNEVENQFFIDHFNKMDIDAESLMNHLGRKKRFLINNENENALTMAIESSKKALEQANIKAEDLDMIVFVSDTPEYFVPNNALIINNKLGAKNANIVYDLNNNCTGMITALDQVSRYIKQNPRVKNALIVGSLMITAIFRKDDPVAYANIGDASAAIVLQQKDEEFSKGFIDSAYITNSMNFDRMVAPASGYSKILKENIEENDKRLLWIPHDVSYFSDEWKRLILELLDRNNLSPEEIDHYLFSQFTKPDIEETLKKLEVSFEKTTFIAEIYGYTGNTSPFFALKHAVEDGKVKEGSKVVFCSVGAGYSMSAALYQY